MSGLGDIFGSSDDESQKYLEQAMQQYNQVQVPTTAEEQVNNLPMESVQGTVNPEQIQAAQQAPTAYNNISLDPSTRQAQINALNAYQTIANTPGLDPAAKLELQQTIDAANQQSQGAQGAIQQQAQAMGQGGGDFALTQRAIAAQGASNNAANEGMTAAATAEANRQAALANMANLGSNIENTDYTQQANKAASTNTINASNTANTQQANIGNVANNLTGQTTNLQNAQNVNAANTTAGQGQVYYNAALPQQQFNNEITKASGMAGVNTTQANVAQQAAANNAAMTGKLIGAAGTIGGAMIGGPAGAVAGNALGNAVGGTTASTTPKNAVAGQNMADGGVVCMAKGGEIHNHYLCLLNGGKIPGRAQVAGDSLQNDVQPILASPGEIVVKRSAAQNPETAAKEAKRISMQSFTNGYKRGKR